MNREAKIGLFVLVALAVMAYFVLRTSDVTSLFSNADAGREVRLALDDASGVREGTDVRIAGVKVGKVERIELADTTAIVVITVPGELEFRDGAYGQLQSQGVLGDRYVALYLGEGELVDQTQIEGRAPASLDDITSNVNTLAQNLIEITDNIKQGTLNDQGDNRIQMIAANIEKLSEALVAMVEANQGNVNTVTGEIAALTTTLNRDIPVLVQEMTQLAKDLRGIQADNRGEIDGTISNINTISENIDRVSASLASIAGKIDQGDGTIGKLVNDGETVEKFNQLLDTANESVAEVKNLLGRATDTDIRLGVRTEYLVEHEAARTFFGVTVRPTPDKYYLIEGVGRETDYLPREIDLVTEDVFDADGNLISRSVQRREDEVDDFVINGILAYRFGNMFLKGGLFESEGGGGIDYLFDKEEKLQLSLEAFDFNRDELSAHGKATLFYSYNDNIRFSAGWDEFLESDLSSAMIGAGIRWTDEDIKTLIGAAGSLFRF